MKAVNISISVIASCTQFKTRNIQRNLVVNLMDTGQSWQPHKAGVKAA